MMKKKQVKTIILTGLLALVLFGSYFLYQHLKTSVETKTELKYTEVQEATDFEIIDKDGNTVYLSDFKDGKPIIINFWSSKCSPCVQEMPVFQTLYEEYKDQVHFVMINVLSDTNAAQSFIDSYQYTFPIYHDTKGSARKAISVPSLPTTYIIDENFQIVRGGNGVVTYPMMIEALNQLLNN